MLVACTPFKEAWETPAASKRLVTAYTENPTLPGPQPTAHSRSPLADRGPYETECLGRRQGIFVFVFSDGCTQLFTQEKKGNGAEGQLGLQIFYSENRPFGHILVVSSMFLG